MFDDLDEALRRLLDDAAAPAVVRNADVDFVAPERAYAPAQATLNLFFHDLKENRELRDPVPIRTPVADGYRQSRPPIRVDCSYAVTAWSGSSAGTAARVAEEHELLGTALVWLSRFAMLPLPPGVLPGQPFPPPMWVAQMPSEREASEFWSALGIAPRPSFSLVVTIAMDLALGFDAPMVTTLTARHLQSGQPRTAEERATIGGVVRTAAGVPVPGAWVRLEPPAPAEPVHFIRADAQGRFVFSLVALGIGYALRARASGFADVVVPIDVPSPSGDYIVQFV
jgi:Pvc16 N-terminal domain/Carboxypeptidase regulatory-like domain